MAPLGPSYLKSSARLCKQQDDHTHDSAAALLCLVAGISDGNKHLSMYSSATG